MIDCGGSERKPLTKEGEERIPLVTRSELYGGICITPDEDCGSGMTVKNVVNSSFNQRDLVDKLTIKASSWEVHSNVNC